MGDVLVALLLVVDDVFAITTFAADVALFDPDVLGGSAAAGADVSWCNEHSDVCNWATFIHPFIDAYMN